MIAVHRNSLKRTMPLGKTHHIQGMLCKRICLPNPASVSIIHFPNSRRKTYDKC